MKPTDVIERTNVLAISGSLRRGSFNTAALRAAQELAPEGMTIQIYDRLAEIPPFNQDVEGNLPEAVSDLKRRVYEADAILVGLPEHNYSVPGVLKNAIDWASRPKNESAWAGKPVAIISASTSMFGGARAQYHLRQSFVFLNMLPINAPEVMIAKAHERFDAAGRLTDAKSRELIAQLLQNLQEWTVLVTRDRAAIQAGA